MLVIKNKHINTRDLGHLSDTWASIHCQVSRKMESLWMDSTHGNICENWYLHKEFIHATTRVCMITAVLSCDWFTPRGAVQRGHVTFCQSEQPASKVFFVKFGRTTESMARRSSYLLVWIRHPWCVATNSRGLWLRRRKISYPSTSYCSQVRNKYAVRVSFVFFLAGKPTKTA